MHAVISLYNNSGKLLYTITATSDKVMSFMVIYMKFRVQDIATCGQGTPWQRDIRGISGICSRDEVLNACLFGHYCPVLFAQISQLPGRCCLCKLPGQSCFDV